MSTKDEPGLGKSWGASIREDRHQREFEQRMRASMPRTLDRNRAYAEIHGIAGAVFQQDNAYFDGNGLEIRHNTEPQ